LLKKGQALVEFALVLVVFLTIVLGIVDWGLYIFSRSQIDNATRDAVRTAITWNDWNSNLAGRTAQVKAIITDRTQTIPSNIKTGLTSKVYITLTPDSVNPTEITVEVRAQTYKPTATFIKALVPKTISSKSTMRYERR